MDANKEIVNRFIEEMWNERKLDVADEIFAADCITHQLRSAGDLTMPRGPEALKLHIGEWLASFPDIKITIEQMIAEADRVMTLLVARGTHTGAWLGVPPTGKLITIRMAVIDRIRDGRIAEDWVMVDSLGMFQQLGVVNPTAELLAEFNERS